jgi:hypothetical protein
MSTVPGLLPAMSNTWLVLTGPRAAKVHLFFQSPHTILRPKPNFFNFLDSAIKVELNFVPFCFCSVSVWNSLDKNGYINISSITFETAGFVYCELHYCHTKFSEMWFCIFMKTAVRTVLFHISSHGALSTPSIIAEQACSVCSVWGAQP